MGKRIIHIVESLDKGAVENWLVRMLEFSAQKGENHNWTFYCIESFEGRLERKVKELGGSIIKANFNWSQPIKLIKDLRRTIVKHKYDVLHSHHDFMSALYLLAVIKLPIRKIVHVHNMDEHIPTSSKSKATILRFIFRHISCLLTDKIVGISKHTLNKFINECRFYKNKASILYYGYPHSLFVDLNVDKCAFRKELYFSENSKIMLFCGRLDVAKNPLFAVRVLAELIKTDSNYVGMFVGKGSLEKETKDLAHKLGLSDKIMFIGWSDNVPKIMANSDVFISPHVHYPMEGFGLVVLEAQLASLPVVVSKGVSDETFLKNSLTAQLSLKDGPSVWAIGVNNIIRRAKSKEFKPIEDISNSHFYMSYALKELLKFYE